MSGTARMRAPRLGAGLLLLLAAGCLSPRGTADRPAVVGFRIEGARALSRDQILDRIATQPSGTFIWGEPAYYDEDLFELDRRRIEALYRSRGYYRARVVEAVAEPRGKGRVALRLRVEEGEPVRVAEVRFEGLEEAPEALAKLGKPPIAKGDIFTEEAYDAGGKALLAALTSSGYPRAEVEQRAEVDPERREARVAYSARPGGRFRFGGIFVSGTSQIPRSRVREVAGRLLHPGEWYDASRLPRIQASLLDLMVFGGVKVNPGQPDPERGTVPVVVTVREAPFRTVQLGPSLGIQASRWDASLVAGWTHRNWLGDLRRLKLDLRAGWSWIKSPFYQLTAQGPAALASADFTQPELVLPNLDLNVRVEGERRIEEGYRYWAERVRLGTPIRLGRFSVVRFLPDANVTFIPSINADYYQTRGEPTQDVVAGQTQALLSCPGDASHPTQLCFLPYLEQRLDLDLRDDAVNTRRGLYFTVSLQEGVRPFGAGFRYLRLLPEGRAFLPLGPVVVALRGRVGLVRAYGGDDLPIVARLHSGGPSQERGYYLKRLSPVVPLSNGGWAPVGGTGLVDGSLDVRIPLPGSLGLVLFVDGGNTELDLKELWRVDRIQWAAGVGLRYRSPVGPLRLDLAGRLPSHFGGNWPMPTVPVVQVSGGKITCAGAPEGTRVSNGACPLQHTEPIVAIHFSIGEAF